MDCLEQFLYTYVAPNLEFKETEINCYLNQLKITNNYEKMKEVVESTVSQYAFEINNEEIVELIFNFKSHITMIVDLYKHIDLNNTQIEYGVDKDGCIVFWNKNKKQLCKV